MTTTLEELEKQRADYQEGANNVSAHITQLSNTLLATRGAMEALDRVIAAEKAKLEPKTAELPKRHRPGRGNLPATPK